MYDIFKENRMKPMIAVLIAAVLTLAGCNTVEGLGQDARHRGLADAARAGEQVGVVQPLLRQRVGQGLHHVLLAHHFGEISRAVFARQHQIRHGGRFYGAPPRWPL